MLRRNLVAIAIAITIFLTIAGSSNVLADSCKNVKFTVRNDRNGDIEIRKVSYFNQNENQWKDEDVPNILIPRGQTKTFGKEDLGDSEGDNITKVKFVYEDKNSRDERESAVFVPTSPKCVAEKNFGFGQGWAITGSSPVKESDGFLSSDSCKNVVFNYTNGRLGDIKVKSVKYFNRNSGDWKTEDVNNEITQKGAKGATNTDDLGDAEGDDITKVIFIYEYKSTQRGANWTDPIESKIFVPIDPKCRAGKVYGLGQVWTIGNEINTEDTGGSNPISDDKIGTNNGIDPIKQTGGEVKDIAYKTPTATKSASLIYFNYGENSEFTKFFQDTLHVKKAMEGYQRVVLIKPNELPSWADLSEADEKNADVILPPTKDNFFNQIKDLAAKGYHIDIYIFSHGWNDQFGPKNNDAQVITSADITTRLSRLSTLFTTMPIRTVWGTNCYGSTLATEWHGVGAKTVAGARYVNFYPNSYGNFIGDWNKGNVSFNNSVSGSDTSLVRTAVQTYILGDATLTRGEWGGCPLLSGITVLGNHACAKDYFVTEWIDASEWKSSMSGKDNMNNSSTMIITGDKGLTKSSKPKW